jgi:hypothetical protein
LLLLLFLLLLLLLLSLLLQLLLLSPLPDVEGSWEGEEAGGCLNDVRLWRANRQYALFVQKDVEITLKVRLAEIAELLSFFFFFFLLLLFSSFVVIGV